MKLWILYNSGLFENKSKSPEIMLKEAINHGISAEILYHDKFNILLENNLQKLYYGNKKVSKLPDIIFCRGYDKQLLDYFELNGCAVINSSKGMDLLLNKYATHLKVSQLKDVNQPKTLIGKSLTFSEVKTQLGLPFVMKDNFGGKGINVFLINDENSFMSAKLENTNTTFIYQEFISSSFGKDLRCYVVGEKVFAVTRHSSDNNEFRANLSQGGHAEFYKLTKTQIDSVLAIKNLLNIEIGSVDFLFGKDENIIFCEANGNAAFKSYTDLGINLRHEFFDFIKNKYKNKRNFIEQKKELTNKKSSFEILEGTNNIILSAPHNVMQIRELEKKSLDLGTGHLLLNLINLTTSYGIIKTNCIGVPGKVNDDANYDEIHPYKTALSKYINTNKIKYLIDLHSMAKTRPEQINIGINGGQNIQYNFSLLKEIETIFYQNGFLVSVDYPFNAGKNTISNYIASENNIFSIQIEINSKLIHLKDNENQFEKISAILIEIVELIKNK